MKRDEDTEYNRIEQILMFGLRKNTGLQSTSENLHLAEMEVFVFFIYQMTLLVRIVGGSKLTPYDSNCSKSVCVCVFVLVCMFVCAECSGVCVSGHQTELQGLQQGTAARWISSEFHEGKCQRGDIIVHITPTLPSQAITLCVLVINMQIE